MKYLVQLRAVSPSDPDWIENTTVVVQASDEAEARKLGLEKAQPPMFLAGCEWEVVSVEAPD